MIVYLFLPILIIIIAILFEESYVNDGINDDII